MDLLPPVAGSTPALTPDPARIVPVDVVKTVVPNTRANSVAGARAAITASEARAIAKEAYVYGFPLVDSYRVQYSYFADGKGPEFKGPWNQIVNTPRVYTPADTAIQTPNSDTPYSFIGMDLRAEPIVLTVPRIDKERYYSVQLIDAYTFNFDYIGSRTTGNDGGSFLIAGPNWQGDVPRGVEKMIRAETEFVFALCRTQLFNPSDLDGVKKVQAGYKAQTLSAFLGTAAPQNAPAVDFIKPLTPEEEKHSPQFFNILSFVLKYCPTHPSEAALRARFAQIGVGGGESFDVTALAPEMAKAIEAGIADAWTELAGLVKEIDVGKVTAGQVFGTREYLKNNYLYRMVAAVKGIYGNTKQEAMYPVYAIDDAKQKLDGAHRYSIHFASGQLPPVNAFWSLTMYELPASLLVANPINRYLINSPMLPQLKRDEDGGLTLLIQNDSPGKDREANWLPAPRGPFIMFMRLYWPKVEAVEGKWAPPPIIRMQQSNETSATSSQISPSHSHGWIGTETVKTRLGEFEFKNSYPTSDAAQKLREALTFNRAVEAFLTQMHGVSWYRVWKGVAMAGTAAANQIVLWESLMDSATLLLTGNTETVYGLCSIDLKRDGPVVIEAPAMLLGGASDLWQREVMGIGPNGIDKGCGGKLLLLPPDYNGAVPPGYLSAKSSTFGVVFGVRGFQIDGKPDKAVTHMKTTRIYPLSEAANPPAAQFVNGSHQEIDTIFSDDGKFFDDLAWMIEREPLEIIASHERFQLAAIGIEKDKPFKPDPGRRAVLNEAARFAAATARVNSFASEDDARLVYSDRKWEWAFVGGSATWDAQGYLNTDRRAGFAYIAIGMSPAMADKHVGVGSQYLWTAREASGAFLDGAKSYQLHIPPNIPVKNFWSVVAYDADSRSILRNGQAFPSVSSYTNQQTNSDGSIDVYFAPKAPEGKTKNWVQTMPGKGWFILFRFYGPLEAFFDKSWKPDDIVAS